MNKTRTGKLVMACMTPAAEGTRISIQDPEAVAFRAGIIEGMMLNHPHDCPVCDEGGECHLQDMTVMTGHDYRRYAFQETHFPQSESRPVRESRDEPLHPVLPLRAFLSRVCRRQRPECVWHCGTPFTSAASEDGVLENEFAGNLVEICPTGVFTDRTL